MTTQRNYDQGSVLEKGWFIALLLALLVIVGGTVWWMVANPEKVAAWVNGEETRVRVEKPMARSGGLN